MRSDLLWRPNLIVFVSNACIMIIELVAGRMVAPYLGVSLYTWTSVIGVILAGISFGNYIGGKLADRWASRRLLGGLFILSGFASLSVLLTIGLLGSQTLPSSWPLMVQIVVFITAVFFLPSSILGTISPVVVKLTLRDLETTGNVVGKIYASSALGSIIGTFATGFFLISWFGTRSILLGVAVVLIVLGILLGQWRRGWIVQTAAIVIVIGLAFVQPVQALLTGPCFYETNYFCIKVYDRVFEDGTEVRVLALDRLVHSYTSLEDPTRLIYRYEMVYAETTEYLVGRDPERRALFVGGGGYTFPKFVEAIFPQVEIDVVEIDPMVTRTAYLYLGLQDDTNIRSINQDARQYLIDLPSDERYDLVYGDAFNDYSVPYHLTTHEFNELVAAHLTPDGVYMVNLIDGGQRRFLSSYGRTLQETFPYVYVVPIGDSWQDVVLTTFVVLASQEPLDLTELRNSDGGNASREIDRYLLSTQDLESLISAGDPVYLTDDHVPVDNLLAPVFDRAAASR